MLFSTVCMFAGSTSSGSQSPGQGLFNLFPIVLMFVVFYFLLIRPQTKRQREMETMQKSLKPGMKVMTSSGVIGQILNVREKTLTLRSADSKLEFTRSAVTEILERGEEEAETAAPPVKKP